MTDKKELAAMLVHLSDWCVAHRLGSGIFHDTPEGADEVEDSIFINGNLARVTHLHLRGHRRDLVSGGGVIVV